jgi:hypothetical protein
MRLSSIADSSERSDAGRNTDVDRRQLTLDDWIDVLRASRPEAPAPRSPTSEVVAVAGLMDEDEPSSCAESGDSSGPHRRSATELLEIPGALLTRSHLRELGLERRAIDAVFRKLAVVFLPGYSRPLIRVEDYLELVEEFTYRDERVRPIARAS